MRYMMLICGDGIPASDAEEEFAERALVAHVADSDPLRLFGHPLLGRETATTVRVRDGETILTDGPFVETKEHIVGFQVMECETREQAIDLAAQHPMSWFHKVEVRPLADDAEEWDAEALDRLWNRPADGMTRYLFMICSDGVPTPDKRETMQREVPSWLERVRARGAQVVGNPLSPPSTAATVRVRGPKTLVTDGPFVETKEFLAGFDVIDCANLDDAIEIAAAHPVSWFHAIEIRPFTPEPCVPTASRSRRREPAIAD